MSRRYRKITGGSKNSSVLKFELPTENCTSEESSSSFASEYKSRLRPRPTRQTDYFRSPSVKRKKQNGCQPSSFGETSNRLAQEQSISGVEKQSLNKSDVKRSCSDHSDLTSPKKEKNSALSKLSAETSKEKQGKEVSSKLWFPFIAPVTSSDSEEEEFDTFSETAGSTSATLHTTRKLASKSSKSTTNKGSSTKDKANHPSTSSSKSNSGASGSTSKVFSSKSTSRFSFSRFTKSDSSSKNTDEINKEAGCSQESSSQGTSKIRTSATKQLKTSKAKNSLKSKAEENKPKNRKRYQSPPNHPLYSSRTFTNSSKTGSCASTSRRGRGKSAGGQSQAAREEPGASSEMSREGLPAADEPPANQAGPGAADSNQQQALLEARGLPSHFFGALGPRVQQILNRSVNSGTSSKSQQLLQGMQATGDESRQLQSVIEMCQLLVMGNEDTLSGFPVKMAVPTLITLLKMEHNFDMMNHACRALTYMMEALPRSSAVVVDAVPVFLEKLQSIQCMDVAEQSLTALEMLSRRHSAAILRANGLSSCLLYLDFFSLPAQRNALAVAANCCSVLSPSEHSADFEKTYGSSMTMLVQRITHHDKKCVESICLCFARLIDNFRNNSDTLQVITNNMLLENLQNLLVVTPPLIGSNTFVMVIRTMCLLCSSCPNLATQLVRSNIADTLRYLLCGTATESESIELVPRSPQELYEITSLIGELMPRLPLDDPMFSIDRLLKHNSKGSSADGHVTWQWKGDDGIWRSYAKHDNRMIEEAQKSGDHEASVLIQGRVYMIDFNVMQQINEDTGNHRPVRRQANEKESNDAASATKSDSTSNIIDARVSLVKDDHAVISQFVRSLFTLLYEVYGSSAGSPAVRHKCLRAVQRMIYYAEPELLRDVLKNLSVSSHIASMLSSNDLKVVVGALQMSMILMKKLPDVFEVYFRRQGVTHQVEQLLDERHKVVGVGPPSSPQNSTLQSDAANMSTPVVEGAPSSTNPSPMDAAPGRLSDMLRRKHPPRKGTSKRISSSSLTTTPEDSKQLSMRSRLSASSPSDRVISPPLTKAKAFAAALSTFEPTADTPTGPPKSKSGGNSARSSASSFFYNLNPVRWGRASTSGASLGASSSASQHSASSTSSHPTSMSRENLILPNLKKTFSPKENREEVKQWIREQAKLFLEKYFSSEAVDGPVSEHGLMDEQSLLTQLTSIAQNLVSCTRLSDACESLRQLSSITSTSDVSSFELQHSGIITSLIVFLTQVDGDSKKDLPLVRKAKSTITPPMVTRRRMKMDSRKTASSISESNDCPLKMAASDETGRFVADNSSSHFGPAVTTDSASESERNSVKSFHPIATLPRDDRIRHFLHVFVGLPDAHFTSTPISVSELGDVELLRNLVEKLNLCVSQLEQFAVRSHDLPSAPGRGSQALSFFAKHQLKCQLQRHPDCSKGKQWHSGPVRVDPLALVQAIERYLITRGYGAASNDDKNNQDRRDIFMLMDDDDSEDEIDVDDDDDDDEENDVDLHPLSTTATSATHSASSSSGHKHRLELYIGSNKLPYNMTVYQAVKHFSDGQSRCAFFVASSDRDTDDELQTLSSTNVWNSTHTIHYKLVVDTDDQSATSGGNKKGSQKLSPKLHRRNDALYMHGTVASPKRPLDRFLSSSFSSLSISSDPSKEVLCLMRVLFGLTLNWHNLYASSSLRSDRELMPKADFVNSKLSMKAHRQLQDPLMIMTGELPQWLSELAHSCSFIFSFETRQLLFRIVSFDRDRAMQYLYDTGALPDTSSSSGAAASSMGSDTSHRFVPKIEKKKCVVKRESLLHQAEKVLHDHGNARSLLEVQYEGEVGTGLGPTLEFYTLTSHELQKVELGLWRSDEKSDTIESNRNAEPTSLKKLVKKQSEIEEEEVQPAPPDNTFVHSPVGLYPLPIGRSSKLSAITKIKAKFRFLGKLLAKSAMDGRMVDIPLSVVCYKWLLSKENEITWFDLEQVDPGFTLTFNKLKNVLHQRLTLEQEASGDLEEKMAAITMDGCNLEDLGLDFLLPGFPNLELMKGGSKMSLSINNIDKYLSLIAHWTLVEGVRYQLEAVREGFQSVFSLRNIDYFFPEELDELFCGARYQPWNERELADCCLTDHGYTHDSETVKTLFRVLSQYDVAEQRSFLQFVTGSPHLPVGGLRALHPQLTIVRKPSEEGHSADEYLPSVMTCVNYLKLPEYSSEVVMRQRLGKAAREGQKSFLLS